VERKEKVQEDDEGLSSVKEEEQERGRLEVLYDDGFGSVTVKDYFAAAKVLCGRDDGGPPRWFSPVECGQPAVDDAPLLLFLPGSCVRPFTWPNQSFLPSYERSWPNGEIILLVSQLFLC
jgi:hypothetical protein